VHRRPAIRSRTARVDEITVVVPLEVADLVLVEQRDERRPQVVVAVGVGEVEHLLLAARRRHPARHLEDPVRMGASHIRVEVDHLRLDPQAELHAVAAHAVDERMQTLRVHIRRDPPVSQSPGLVAPGTEPAVVEDEALGADLCAEVDEPDELYDVVVEVGRLPAVERDGTRRRRVALPSA